MVPNGWEKKVFGEIVKLSKAKYNPMKSDTCLPCIELEHLAQGTGQILGSAPASSLASIKNKFQAGDVIFGKLRPYLRKYAKPTFEGVCSTEIWVFDPTNKVTNPYLFQFVQTDKFISEANKSAGSKMPRADWGVVSEMLVPLPPIPEQQKVAKILSTWDKAISTTQCLIDNSKQQKKALMQQLLSGAHKGKRLLDDSGKPFEGKWKKVKLDDVVLSTQLGTSERTKNINESSVIPLIKMGNLTWGGFNFNKLETIPKSIVDNNLILQHGDFLFNTRNTPDLVGKSAVWKGQLTEVTFDNNINRITFDHSVNTDFICFYLTHGKGKSTINSLPAGSTSVAAIYWKDLKNIKVPLPVVSEQSKIISVLNNADREIELLDQQLADLKQEKKALMQQLLTGKRRVKTNDTEAA